jgi:Na+/proline symporter
MNEPVLEGWIAGILLAVFSVLWVWLGWWWGRGAKDIEGYMLAGRRVGLALAAATAMATWVTSNTTLMAPQLAYQYGIWGMIGYSLGSVGLLLFAPMAARIRRLMPHGFTSGQFMRLRYGKAAWAVFLLLSLVYGTAWLVTLGAAGGKLIYALSGISEGVGATVILTICVLYTLLGGLRAVIGTDFVQTIVIITGLFVVGAMTLSHVGLGEVHAKLTEVRPRLLDLLMPASVMFLFNNLLFGIGEIFHSNVWWSRAFAFDKGVGFKAYLLAGLLWIPIPIVAGFVALSAPALGLAVPSADMVGPIVAADVIGLGGAILLFIVVFSAISSGSTSGCRRARP